MTTSSPGALVAPGLLALLMLATALTAPEARAQGGGGVGTVTGLIVDQATGEPLPSASLEVVGSGVRGPASDDGRFKLPPMPVGPITLRVFHLGFEARTEVVEVLDGQTVDVRIGLVRNTTFELEPVVVTIRSPILERRGFYERRSQGFAGFFITREDILARDPQNVTDLFADLPGLMILPGDLDGPQVVFQRAVSVRDSGVCRPALYLDGVKSQVRLYDMVMDPLHVEGVEVYVGAGTPTRFNDPCGAILIWTR